MSISKKIRKQNTFLHDKHYHFYHTVNARLALQVLLQSASKTPLNVGVQAYTCHTVFQAIKNAGHHLVFFDINDELKLDLSQLRMQIRNIDILIITHTFGFPENIDEIKRIAGSKIIIEDCAHSFLTEYNRKQTGLSGDAAVFSTGLGKFPPIGANGFFVVNERTKFPNLVDEWECIKSPGLTSQIITKTKLLLLSLFMRPPLYGLITHPFGKMLDKKLDFANKFEFSEKRGFNWAIKALNDTTGLYNLMKTHQTNNAKLLSSLLNTRSFYVDSTITVSPNNYVFPLLITKRDELFDKLLINNIEAGKHFANALKWASAFGYKKGECPHTERIINKIITIPIHYGVSNQTIIKAARIINEHINET